MEKEQCEKDATCDTCNESSSATSKKRRFMLRRD
jgi:hypothetical protein